ncbi:MAG TPA: RNA-guided endonuclease TnpB family protein [Streptosporangiaceae bacterium]|nr:RNA-guided endonuclease TnpB family protein [Streptosporangiaceae bacterium]
MQLRYNYRLYPSPGQQQALARAFGCARVVFNDALAVRRDAHQAGLPYPTDAELSARLTAAKTTPQRAWLGEVSAVMLQQALADLTAAWRNFFASRDGGRRGPKVGAPRFRSRRDERQAIRFTRNARFTIVPGGKLRLPKIGDVPVRWSRLLPGVPSSVTVVKDAAGRYFASFVVEAGQDLLPEAAAETGIDLGLTHFAVLSDGRKIASPRFLRRAKIGRFEPTSQLCSACGVKDGPKPLSVREWMCASCGTFHDRDVNAARNVLALGRRGSLNACGGTVRPALVLAGPGEIGSRRGAA